MEPAPFEEKLPTRWLYGAQSYDARDRSGGMDDNPGVNSLVGIIRIVFIHFRVDDESALDEITVFRFIFAVIPYVLRFVIAHISGLHIDHRAVIRIYHRNIVIDNGNITFENNRSRTPAPATIIALALMITVISSIRIIMPALIASAVMIGWRRWPVVIILRTISSTAVMTWIIGLITFRAVYARLLTNDILYGLHGIKRLSLNLMCCLECGYGILLSGALVLFGLLRHLLLNLLRLCQVLLSDALCLALGLPGLGEVLLLQGLSANDILTALLLYLTL